MDNTSFCNAQGQCMHFARTNIPHLIFYSHDSCTDDEPWQYQNQLCHHLLLDTHGDFNLEYARLLEGK